MRHSFRPIVVNGGLAERRFVPPPHPEAEPDARWQKLLAFGYLVSLAAIIAMGIIATAILVKQVADPLLLDPPLIAQSR